jgi:Ca-activated chloride channel family protein
MLARRDDDAEPPPGLLEKIKCEIPRELPARVPAPAKAIPIASRRRLRTGWLMAAAASVVAAIGAGFFALRVQKQTATLEQVAASQEISRDAAGRAQAPAPMTLPPPPSGAPVTEAPAPRSVEPEVTAERMAAKEEAKLNSLGYVVPEPAQPAEVSEESEGGVPGGVPGGVVGGVPGGVVSVPGGVREGVLGRAPAVPSNEALADEAPLRIGRTEQDKTQRAALKAKRQAPAAAPSTGGTAEPNDQPYGDMFFESAGTNPFIDAEEDALSTFALDVDSGSYTVVRRYLSAGNLPPAAAVRVEEMVNFFDYGDAPPSRGDFAIRLEGAPTPFAQGDRYRLLRINLRGREVAADQRKPAVLTFVVDVSGSMDQENRLGLVKKSLGLLLDQLRPTDEVGLVIYGDEGKVLLEPTGDHQAIRRAIERLAPGGSTNAEEGIVLGYEVARRNYRSDAVNRVVLCSDGVANMGATGPSSILARIDREADRGVELTTLGFGMGNYNDVLMEQLANKGDGRYAYIDSVGEAHRVLAEELTGTLQTIAKDAKVQVEFNPRTVMLYRLLGYENRDVADERFRDDSVDAGEIGAGHSVTALYEVKLQPDASPRAELATVRLRYLSARTGRVQESEESIRLNDFASSWDEASPALRLASVVAEFAEILRGSYWAKDGNLNRLAALAQKVSAEFAGRNRAGDVAEFAALVGKVRSMK